MTWRYFVNTENLILYRVKKRTNRNESKLLASGVMASQILILEVYHKYFHAWLEYPTSCKNIKDFQAMYTVPLSPMKFITKEEVEGYKLMYELEK